MSSKSRRARETRKKAHSCVDGVGESSRAPKLTYTISYGWIQDLVKALEDPDQVVKDYDDFAILRDKYPKARHHYLMVVKAANLHGPENLKRRHISLLESMLEKGQQYVDEIRKKEKTAPFQLGFHAVPSLARLHMHMISRDFYSPWMKTKKHWHSFTTVRFIFATEAIKELKENGKLTINRPYCNDILRWPLKCHVCNLVCRDMKSLKSHISQHHWNDIKSRQSYKSTT